MSLPLSHLATADVSEIWCANIALIVAELTCRRSQMLPCIPVGREYCLSSSVGSYCFPERRAVWRHTLESFAS